MLTRRDGSHLLLSRGSRIERTSSKIEIGKENFSARVLLAVDEYCPSLSALWIRQETVSQPLESL